MILPFRLMFVWCEHILLRYVLSSYEKDISSKEVFVNMVLKFAFLCALALISVNYVSKACLVTNKNTLYSYLVFSKYTVHIF